MPETITIQLFHQGRWLDAGDVRFLDPGKGLTGRMHFYYNPAFIAEVAGTGFEFTDERAVGANVPANFTGHYDEAQIAPVLRDIIPQGAGRRALERLWGFDRPTGPELDFRLLRDACIAPVGNLRIKEAAEPFYERVTQQAAQGFTVSDIANRASEVIEHAHDLGIAIGGATGAGGDAPKLLVVEDGHGRIFLEGTLAEDQIRQHWLVKFPRGQKTAQDRDVLRAEGIFYQALAACDTYTIQGARLIEGNTPSLWLPRFDRAVQSAAVHRYGMESTYSVMGMLGNGARLQHPDVISALTIHSDTDPDEILTEYLVRDIINKAIGNTDNHGRNSALLKRDGKVFLAPAFDLAPMVLDHEGIARSSVWPTEYRDRQGNTDYPAIVKALASSPENVASAMEARLYELTDFPAYAIELGLPETVQRHPQVNLDLFEQLWPVMTDLIRNGRGQDPH